MSGAGTKVTHNPREYCMIGRTSTGARDARRKLDAELDRALAQTFPASDPFSVGHFTATEPPSRPTDTKPPVMTLNKAARSKRRQRKVAR